MKIKIVKLMVIATTMSFIVACNSKKAANSVVASIVPTNVQLKAIQAKYPEVTMQTLANGHDIYIGVCTNCHGMKNIYKRSEESWKHEIDVMAPKAKITDSQKNELFKYILSMKASEEVQTK
jgi:hypothetical protein